MQPPGGRSDEKREIQNLRDEMEGVALYRALSQSESDPSIAAVYAKLEAVEEAHAEYWRRRLVQRGIAPPAHSLSARTLGLIWLSRRFGAALLAPLVARFETADSAKYDAQSDAGAARLARDERKHARLMSAIASQGSLGGPQIAKLEGRHAATGGNALRAAVLGANDGLLSNLSLVMGITGAAADNRIVLITGLAGLVAGACSMALGEWLSVTSSRELYARQISIERAELNADPQSEAEELALIYQAKGLPADQATALASRLMADTNTALDTLAREELGIDPNELGGSALVAAGASFALFATGAMFPILPFFFLRGSEAILWGLIASGAALGAVGALTSLFTGRAMVFSALRQVVIGASAAATTYFIGKLLGAAITG